MKNLSKIFEQYVGRDVKIHPLQQIVGTWEHKSQTGLCYVLNEHGCPTTKGIFDAAAYSHMKAIIKLPRHPLDLGFGPETVENKQSAVNGVVICNVEPNGKKGFRIASIDVNEKKRPSYK